MRTELELIFETYAQACEEAFTKHPTAEFIRNDLASAVRNRISGVASDFTVEASAGKGRWAATPWVAILDPLVTDTPQTGVYIVYLFSKAMDSLYLSLNQGITHYRNRFGSAVARSRLGHIANVVRMACPDQAQRFDLHEIDLAGPSSSSLSAFCESGHIFGKRYDVDLPEEDEMQADLEELILAYRRVGFCGIAADVEGGSSESPGKEGSLLEHNDRIGLHWRVERNAGIARMVKKLQGTVCAACGFDYEKVYGALGSGFIEAHHNTPLAELTRDRAVPLDPTRDFTVLCSNCHRMVHRENPPLLVTELRQIIRSQLP